MEGCVSFKPRPLYPRKCPPVPIGRGLSGPVLKAVEKRKILSLLGIEPRPSRPFAIPTELLPTGCETVYRGKYKHYNSHQVQRLGPFWHFLTSSLPRSSSGTPSSRLFPRSLAEGSSGILNIPSLQPVLQSSVVACRLRTLKLSSHIFTASPIQKCWTIVIKNLHVICFYSSYPVCC
jgi:hypothetical protein